MHRGTVLITGASSGIGEAFARRFAAQGFDLILTARRRANLQAISDSLANTGVAVHIVAADLATPDGPSLLCDAVDALGIPVDILINNAGMMADKAFDELSMDEVQAMISLNIIALTRLTHHFIQLMKKRKVGRILNVASMAGFHPVPAMDIYAATKSYVLSLTESLAENLKGTGVSVTALCPGLTMTDMADQNLASLVPPFLIGQPESVASEGYDALMNREVIRIPGNVNKVAITWAQHQPRWLIRQLAGLASKLGPQ